MDVPDHTSCQALTLQSLADLFSGPPTSLLPRFPNIFIICGRARVHDSLRGEKLFLNLYALIEARDASALLLAIFNGEFPFLFIGDHPRLFVAEGGDL